MKTATLKNGLELTLRKAEPEDAAAILAYLNRIGGESDNLTFGENGLNLPPEQEAAFIQSVNASKTSVMLVGFVEGEVACLGDLSASTKERLAHVGEVSVSVGKKFWRQGVGEQLMKALMDFARDTGVLETLHLGVKADNAGAIALYRKLGFTEYGRFPRFFHVNGQYYDEILMYRTL